MKGKRKYLKFLLFILIIFLLFKSNNIFSLANIKSNLSNNYINNFTKSDEYMDIKNIHSNNAIVIKKSNNQIIMGKNYEERIHPASMTKVMTAIIGIENTKNFNKKIEITNDIIDYSIQNGLSVSGFEVGDKPKIKDLLYGILLESGAESSIALAREIGGNDENFVNLMNQKAEQLGMNNTHFSNPTGKTDVSNYSTAKDIAILFNYAIDNNYFKNIISSKEYIAKGINGPFSKKNINNQLFQKRNILNINKDFIQYGKTGYTEAAGLCLVSFGSKGNEDYIVVTSKANGNSETPQYNLIDTEYIYNNLIIY